MALAEGRIALLPRGKDRHLRRAEEDNRQK